MYRAVSIMPLHTPLRLFKWYSKECYHQFIADMVKLADTRGLSPLAYGISVRVRLSAPIILENI